MIFNGAASKRTRKAHGARADRRGNGCFNGAASKRTRKVSGLYQLPGVNDASMGPRPNGRGRGDLRRIMVGLPAASMGPRPNGRGRTTEGIARAGSTSASMGPRPNGRGRSMNCCIQRDLSLGFNGAASKRTRKVCAKDSDEFHVWASMGPRPNGRGRMSAADYTESLKLQLQWGRVQTDAEGNYYVPAILTPV